jgi:hypothetical protein
VLLTQRAEQQAQGKSALLLPRACDSAERRPGLCWFPCAAALWAEIAIRWRAVTSGNPVAGLQVYGGAIAFALRPDARRAGAWATKRGRQ